MCIPLEERSLNELPRFTPSSTSYQRVTCREMSTKKVTRQEERSKRSFDERSAQVFLFSYEISHSVKKYRSSIVNRNDRRARCKNESCPCLSLFKNTYSNVFHFCSEPFDFQIKFECYGQARREFENVYRTRDLSFIILSRDIYYERTVRTDPPKHLNGELFIILHHAVSIHIDSSCKFRTNVFLHLGISFIISNLFKFVIRRTIVTNNHPATLKKTTNLPIHLVERLKLEMANISVKIVDASILPSLCESFTIIVEY